MIVANTVLCAGEIWAIVPVIFIAIVVVAVAVAVPALKKLVNSQNVQNVVDKADRVIQEIAPKYNRTTRKSNSGRTSGATDVKKTQSTITFPTDHTHAGQEVEHYEKIVGSLGEVSDEGCDELEGVRLIAHDLAYDGEESNRDYTEVAKIVVLGDVINNPRFKKPFGRR